MSSRTSGMFQAPPGVVNQIYDWALKLLAARWLEVFFPQRLLDIQKDLADAEGWRVDFHQKRLFRLQFLQREMWKILGTKNHRSYATRPVNLERFTPDLRGWRYEKMVSGEPPHFWVSLRADSRKDGSWNPRTRRMEIMFNFDPHSLDMLKSRKKELRDLIAHETVHLGQSYLQEMLKIDTPTGVPRPELRTKGLNPNGVRFNKETKKPEFQIEHAKRDVEFYSRLRDEVEGFVTKASKLPPAHRKEALRVLVAASPKKKVIYRVPGFPIWVYRAEFFESIKEQNLAKWRKAVSEFTKAVSEKISLSARTSAMRGPKDLNEESVVRIRGDRKKSIFIDVKEKKTGPTIASLTMERDGKLWEVKWAGGPGGWGPLVYDLALETVNRVGGEGLFPDQDSVSPEAEVVWAYYLKHRKDVKSAPLAASKHPPGSPLGRSYRKRGTPLMEELGAILGENFVFRV